MLTALIAAAASLAAQEPEIRLVETARIDSRDPAPPPHRAERMRDRPDLPWTPPSDCIRRLVWSADGRFVAALAESRGVLARASGEIVGRFPEAVLIAPGEAGSELWIFGQGSVRRWNADHGRRVETYELPAGWMVRRRRHSCLAHAEDEPAVQELCVVGGRAFVFADLKGREYHGPALFDPLEGTVQSLGRDPGPMPSFTAHPVRMARSETANQIALAQDTRRPEPGSTVLLGALTVFSATGEPVHEELTATTAIAVTYSPEGSRLAYADRSGLICVLDTEGFGLVEEVVHEKAQWLAFLDESVLLGHDGDRVVAWRLPELEPLSIGYDARPGKAIRGAALSPDRKCLALSDGDELKLLAVER